ncbi:Two-component response regulator ORR24 [Hondaea fermentalgiana]|uniref:Two-component response regulator ORR24 n=1 Tax=Hondaea fermentalgiana TaxID=2315210 RepID=A0A2R5GRT6_9STRA|nr:Two-component response regulator ORR24 [Hondaea fermentalgiana]|eukprot:GBG33019.1 Two-component response regulator ORR24 [Hondaea fermentalgiana]
MMKTARVNKKRVREADAEPAGPKAKRCTDCTSTESVDRCESIFHEAGAKAPSGPDDGEIELATGPTAAASATAAAGNLAKASRGAKASKSSASVTSAEEAGASKGGPTNASGGAAKSKSRRLVWNERMHVKFLSIIFDIGLEHASPRKILDRWGLFERGSLDSGHVKSHLQKYRSNSKRTKEVFSEQLEAALKQACDDQINVQHSYPFPRGTKTPISALDMKAIMDEDHDCPFVPCPSIEDMQKGLIMQRPHSFADPHENGEPCLHQGALDPVGPTSSIALVSISAMTNISCTCASTMLTFMVITVTIITTTMLMDMEICIIPATATVMFCMLMAVAMVILMMKPCPMPFLRTASSVFSHPPPSLRRLKNHRLLREQ